RRKDALLFLAFAVPFLNLHSLLNKLIVMTEQIDQIVSNCSDQMKKAVLHLDSELVKVRAGKANPQMIDGIMVDYYGNPTPINQVANVSVADARTLSLQPWE